MQDAYLTLLKDVGETPERDGLKDTPQRAAKALHFLTQGYRMDIDEVINGALFESDNDEMVIVKDIELYSMCEHHMLPFIGKCHVAYLPKGKVIGLSKIAPRCRRVRTKTSDSGESHQRNRDLHSGKDRCGGSGCNHRGETHVHDDAGR